MRRRSRAQEKPCAGEVVRRRSRAHESHAQEEPCAREKPQVGLDEN